MSNIKWWQNAFKIFDICSSYWRRIITAESIIKSAIESYKRRRESTKRRFWALSQILSQLQVCNICFLVCAIRAQHRIFFKRTLVLSSATFRMTYYSERVSSAQNSQILTIIGDWCYFFFSQKLLYSGVRFPLHL